MTLQEFTTYQEDSFEAYCKRLIENEGKNARKAVRRRARHEINLSMLEPAEQERAGNRDVYDLGGMTFFARGVPIQVSDPMLGQALASLTPYRRDVILLFYFMGRSDPQIGALLRRDATTVNYQRHRTLARMRKMMEVLDHEA